MIDKKIIDILKQEQKQLESIINRAEKRLSLAPKGSVLVKRYKKGVHTITGKIRKTGMALICLLRRGIGPLLWYRKRMT